MLDRKKNIESFAFAQIEKLIILIDSSICMNSYVFNRHDAAINQNNRVGIKFYLYFLYLIEKAIFYSFKLDYNLISQFKKRISTL
jgi:hypothetical protein